MDNNIFVLELFLIPRNSVKGKKKKKSVIANRDGQSFQNCTYTNELFLVIKVTQFIHTTMLG